MKNVAKSAFYVAITWAVMGVQNALADITITEPVNPNIRTAGSAEDVIQQWVENLLGFLYIAAVLYALYGGFQILTAAGDDEKVSNGKKVIVQALIGLAVIFLAGSIVEFVLSNIFRAA